MADLNTRRGQGRLRKRAFDARQRALGRKPVQIWATATEAKLLHAFLRGVRIEGTEK